jgi:mannose-6-phosphate isomerase-like protein (cupin superfamily)
MVYDELITLINEEETMAYIINQNDLPGNETSRTFEGYLHNDAHVSFFISATPPGRGPKLHQHHYEEVFVVQSGILTFTVGEETIEVGAGIVIVVSAGTPHKFINSGTEIAHHIDIHVTSHMETEWLES